MINNNIKKKINYIFTYFIITNNKLNYYKIYVFYNTSIVLDDAINFTNKYINKSF